MADTEAMREAQQKRRAALVERIGTFTDTLASDPLEGVKGDVAYDLLRQAAAQIASDDKRIAALTTERSGEAAPKVEELREALANYDTAVAGCPANKQFLGDRPCPKCKAGPNESCREEVREAFTIVRLIRAALKDSKP